MSSVLDFEKPVAEISEKIEELRRFDANNDVDFSDEISRLEKRKSKLAESIFSSLTPWQTLQIARHPMRPYTLDYVERVFTDFQEIHGDRTFADDQAIVAGFARLNDQGVVVIGQQKGRDTNTKIARNFGMPKPEGYRKAQRAVNLAEKFSLPVFTFIDTPGAYPGVDAEQRGQSQAIASILRVMTTARTPIIASVIGEGGSGGALAIGIADHVVMLQYAVYSVISPEGCASILWKDAAKAEEAASVLGLTSSSLLKNRLIDGIINEPLGGAHQDFDEIATQLKLYLEGTLADLSQHSFDELVKLRQQRLMSYGEFQAIK